MEHFTPIEAVDTIELALKHQYEDLQRIIGRIESSTGKDVADAIYKQMQSIHQVRQSLKHGRLFLRSREMPDVNDAVQYMVSSFKRKIIKDNSFLCEYNADTGDIVSIRIRCNDGRWEWVKPNDERAFDYLKVIAINLLDHSRK